MGNSWNLFHFYNIFVHYTAIGVISFKSYFNGPGYSWNEEPEMRNLFPLLFAVYYHLVELQISSSIFIIFSNIQWLYYHNLSITIRANDLFTLLRAVSAYRFHSGWQIPQLDEQQTNLKDSQSKGLDAVNEGLKKKTWIQTGLSLYF